MTTTGITGLLEKLWGKIAEIYDGELAEEITEIYEELASHLVELQKNYENESKRYWDLVRKLALCEEERDGERRAKFWVEERAKVWEGMFEKADKLLCEERKGEE